MPCQADNVLYWAVICCVQVHRTRGQRTHSGGDAAHQREGQVGQFEQRVPHSHRRHRHCGPHRSARHPPPDARARAADGTSGPVSEPNAVQLVNCAHDLHELLARHDKHVDLLVRPDGLEAIIQERAELQIGARATIDARVGSLPFVDRRALRGSRVAAGGSVGRVLSECRAVLRDPAADDRQLLLERAARGARRRRDRGDRCRARAPNLRAPNRRNRPGGCLIYAEVGNNEHWSK